MVCNRVLDLSRPSRTALVRGFQPPYRTLFVYICECGAEHRLRAVAFRGALPEPGVGGFVCGRELKEEVA